MLYLEAFMVDIVLPSICNQLILQRFSLSITRFLSVGLFHAAVMLFVEWVHDGHECALIALA